MIAALLCPLVPFLAASDRARSPSPEPAVLVSWTGADAERATPGFFPITSAAELDVAWQALVLPIGSARAPSDRLKPKIDFTRCVGFAWTGGTTWNTRGYDVRAVELVADAWHVRLAPITYQSHGDGDRTRPYGVFVMARVPGATIVVDEDVRELIDAPPEWKERGRVVVPELVPVVAPPETARLAPRVLDAVRGYERFERVSDRPAWSPFLCQAPPAPGVLASESDDAATHGSKLYHLYAKDAVAYGADDATTHPLEPVSPAPVGQVLVKEAWAPEPVLDAATALAKDGDGLRSDVAKRDGKLWRRGKQLELYVLMKVDPATPDTDRGWIYATVTPDLERVTAAGRVESCMRCHASAPRDRQFGLPKEWTEMREPPR